MVIGLKRLGFRAFGRLPRFVRLRLVRWGTPSYTVGTMVRITRPDGSLLLQLNEHRAGWSLPGGLVARGERPEVCARREVWEETGLELATVGDPVVVVDAAAQRVDVIFEVGVGPDAQPVATSPEVARLEWFAPYELPPLHAHSVGALAALADRARKR